MRTIFAVVAVLALCGCEPTTPERAVEIKAQHPFYDVEVYHDDQRAVTCWKSRDSRGGISCLPDWMLPSQKTAEPERCLVKDVGESEACRELFASPEGTGQ